MINYVSLMLYIAFNVLKYTSFSVTNAIHSLPECSSFHLQMQFISSPNAVHFISECSSFKPPKCQIESLNANLSKKKSSF